MDIGGDRSVLVLGEFDGFHLGHRDLLAAAVTMARRHQAPLDAVVLDDRARRDLLTDPAARCRDLLAGGARSVRVIEIEDGQGGRASGARSIVDRLLASTRPMSVVMSCPPTAPTTMTEAARPQLRTTLEQRGVPVIEVDRRRTTDGLPVTSALISSLLSSGSVEVVSGLLGRPFRVEAEVVRGNQLGRTIGFPTANLTPDERMAIPAHGVYAAEVTLGQQRFRAAVNIGTRPTVDDRGVTVIEAHLLDHSDDLYGRWIGVDFLRRLRDEQRFESLDALTEQLTRDVAAVRALP